MEKQSTETPGGRSGLRGRPKRKKPDDSAPVPVVDSEPSTRKSPRKVADLTEEKSVRDATEEKSKEKETDEELSVLVKEANEAVIVKKEEPENEPEPPAKKVRPAFVPKYEPIQTRKRVKTSHDETASDSPTSPVTTPKLTTPRRRLRKDEVLTPQIGPRPLAVPKSLLILEPEMLPKHMKKKQGQGAPVHASARVDRNPNISWPSAAEMFGETSQAGLEMSSLLLAAAQRESSGQQEITVIRSKDGTSYIITQEGSDGAADDENQEFTVTQLEPPDKSGTQDNSLLLLAEAAYPTSTTNSTHGTISSTSTITSSETSTPIVVSASEKLPKPSAKGSEGSKTNATPAATMITVSMEAGKSPRVVASSTSPISTFAKASASHTTSVPSSSSSQWSCTVCGELMPEKDRRQHLTQHLDEETEEEFVCEVCGEQMRDDEDLELHMAVEHDEEDEDGDGDDGDIMEGDEEEDENEGYTTAEENRAVDSISTVTAPASTIVNPSGGSRTPVHSCQECGETFAFQAYLRQHMKKAHGEGVEVVTCQYCTKTFNTKSELDSHVSLLHQHPSKKLSFNCVRCLQAFPSVAELSKHAKGGCEHRVAIESSAAFRKVKLKGRTSQGQGQGRPNTLHACRICNKKFASEFSYKSHVKFHSTSTATDLHSGKLQCLYCTENFKHLGPLKEHILEKHPKALPFKCTICQRGFSRESSRAAHEHTHQTESYFFCKECGEGFTLEAYLKRHMKYRHLKSTQLPCPSCSKTFVRQADLVKHSRVHTGEKPYRCEICGHGFGQQSNYRYHMMRHLGEKPHSCPICNRGFRVPSHLKIHMQQHLNTRFVCTVCDKAFSQSRYLQRHMKTHSSLIPGVNSIAPSTPSSSVEEIVYESVVTHSQPMKQEQQIIVDSEGTDITEHVLIQDPGLDSEPVIEFVINKDGTEGKTVEMVLQEGNGVINSASHTSVAGDRTVNSPTVQIEVGGEQTFVNPDEGTSVVVGAFSGEEGSSVEEGNVTLPFKDLTQLLGGKHYNCDACTESFSIRPDSTYNMIHTEHGHILVINLNDHHHSLKADDDV